MNRLQKQGLASFFFLGLGIATAAVPLSTARCSPQSALAVALQHIPEASLKSHA
jgi:hypothetical protein